MAFEIFKGVNKIAGELQLDMSDALDIEDLKSIIEGYENIIGILLNSG